MWTKKKKKAYQKAYREANKDKVKAYDKSYREANKEKAKVYMKSYREVNKEKIKNRKKSYRDDNKEKELAYYKAYRKANPEKVKECRRRYRALKLGAYHENYRDIDIFERDGWICGVCGTKINKRLKWPHPRSKSIDHIIALVKGGADAPINLQSTHLRCNLSKSVGDGGQLRLIG